MRAAVAVVTMAVLAGVFGGLFFGHQWFHAGYALLGLASAALLLYVFWKRPASAIDSLMDESPGEDPAAPSVPNLEQELRRRDLGELRTGDDPRR